MGPCKNISHIQVLVIYFLPTPPIKLKLGVQIGGKTTNSKPPRPIIMISQSRTGSSSQIIFITLFSLAGVKLCYAFHQPQQTVQKCWAKTIMLGQNHFAEPNRPCFDFSSSSFDVQGDILSTGGVALISRSSFNSMKKTAKPLCHSSFECSFPATRMNT